MTKQQNIESAVFIIIGMLIGTLINILMGNTDKAIAIFIGGVGGVVACVIFFK